MFEKCCGAILHKDTTKQFVRKQQGSVLTNMVLHWSWRTRQLGRDKNKEGDLNWGEEEISNPFFKLGGRIE